MMGGAVAALDRLGGARGGGRAFRSRAARQRVRGACGMEPDGVLDARCGHVRGGVASTSSSMQGGRRSGSSRGGGSSALSTAADWVKVGELAAILTLCAAM